MPRSSPTVRERSRRLRRDQTDSEARLWSRLRDRRLAGLKFRRQHAIGQFIVDFCCVEARLVVEVDGGQHMDAETYDTWRTKCLECAGYRVVRFWSHDVLLETDAVVLRIMQVLQDIDPGPQ